MRRAALALLAGALLVAPAAAQGPRPPGPWVIDFRGATSGLPNDTAFFPGIPVETIVPARGFGFEAGGHVYLLTLGPSRLGVGASYVRVRGTAPEIVTSLSALAPQVSLNFGTANGWSYLSAGLGRAWIETALERDTGTVRTESAGLNAQNFGGGARWLLTSHIGVGFDVRFFRVSGPPRTTLVAAAVGVCLR